MEDLIWYEIDQKTPPDEMVYIKFDNGQIKFAYPTYYTFDMVDGKVVETENKWDGNWMIEASDFEDHIDHLKITHWAEIKEEDKEQQNFPI